MRALPWEPTARAIPTVDEGDAAALVRLTAGHGRIVRLTVHGARLGDAAPTGPRRLCAQLLHRGVRDLIASRSVGEDAIVGALIALGGGDATAVHDIVHGVDVFVNVGRSLHVRNGADVALDERTLAITRPRGGPRRALAREAIAAAGLWERDALARALSLPIDRVVIEPGVLLPVPLQREPGATMRGDTAAGLRKGAWRTTRRMTFAKEHCVDCFRCIVVCPDGALVAEAPDKKRRADTGVLGIDPERCTACGVCASVCTPDRTGQVALALEGTHRIVALEAPGVA